MTELRCVLILIAVLSLSVSFTVVEEDVPETADDESETLPYVSTSVFSVAAPKELAPAPVVRGVVSQLRSGSLGRLRTQRFGQGPDRTNPIFDALTIRNCSLRC